MSYSIYAPMRAQLPWNGELFTVCNDIWSIILDGYAFCSQNEKRYHEDIFGS